MAATTDPFRRQYGELSPSEQAHLDEFKAKATELHQMLDQPTPSPVDQRCMAIARTKLEEAVFWATKGLTA